MDQASKLRDLMSKTTKPHKGTHTVAVTSGKGGVGKSTLSANLANILALNGYKVALFDADIGLANLDVILNVRAEQNLLNVMHGECEFSDIVINVKENLFLVPGESGADIFKFNDKFLFDKFMNDASVLEGIDYLIIDTGAGIGPATQTFLDASDEVILVTTPDPAAITDAYAVIKASCAHRKRVFMLPNNVKSAQEAERIFSTIAGVVRRNVGDVGLEMLGYVPNDKVVMRSIKSRTLFSDDAPNTEPSVCLKDAASKLLYAVEQKMLDTSKEKSFVGFFKRLAEKF